MTGRATPDGGERFDVEREMDDNVSDEDGSESAQQVCANDALELRLQPQLDTPSPLGRGSSHAPNKPECLLRRGTVFAFSDGH